MESKASSFGKKIQYICLIKKKTRDKTQITNIREDL